jgi:hypothetical protein
MEKEKLIEKVPFIYHLTDKRNLDFILQTKMLQSATVLISMSDSEKKEVLVSTRRTAHETFKIGQKSVWIRDQRPLNAALDKCLTHGWTRAQYIQLLNSRVFFWPNLKRLKVHFGRYENEKPIIFKIALKEALQLNPNAELCHLNSGATRPLGMLGGKAPERGPNTFLPVETYDKGIQKLAEVTFPNSFNLPNDFFIGESPDGNWIAKKLV